MLALAFFVVALLYSAIGFGGGSSYIAILALVEIPYQHIPQLALICNLLVVSGGVFYFLKRGHLNKKLCLYLVSTSVPMAFLGGLYPLSESVFFGLLSVALVLSGARLLWRQEIQSHEIQEPRPVIAMLVGSALGLLAGLVGIGGGIFLSPLMMNLSWTKSKEAAAIASVFIFVNSISGLLGQFIKSSWSLDLSNYIPLFIAVFIGGQIGSRLGSGSVLSQRSVRYATGLLVLFVGLRLLFK